MTEAELNKIEKELYSEENQENYNLAEWARLVVPELIQELRKYISDDPDYSD